MEVVFIYLIIGCVLGLLSGCYELLQAALMMLFWPIFLIICVVLLITGKRIKDHKELEDQDGK